MEYIRRIFANAGKTFTSTYLDSLYAKQIIIPCNKSGVLKNTDNNPEDYGFTAVSNPLQVGTDLIGTNAGNNWTFLPIFQNYFLRWPFNTETADPANAYDITTYEWSCKNRGNYSFNFKGSWAMSFTVSATSTRVSGNIKFEMSIWRQEGAGPEQLITAFYPTIAFDQILPQNTGNVYVFNNNGTYEVTTPIVTCGSSTKIFCKLRQSDVNETRVRLNSQNVNVGTVSLRVDAQTGSQFVGTAVDFNLNINETVEMNLTIPSDMGQLDFLTSVMREENLYIEQDPNNPDNFFIECRDDFYKRTPNDWTSKVDLNQQFKIYPMGDLNFKRYLFKKTTDVDKYNLEYTRRTGEQYGQYIELVDNDFIKEDQTIETIFAPTPGRGNTLNDIVMPAFYIDDGPNNVRSIDVKIRRLYCKGLIPCQAYTIFLNGVAKTGTEYCYAGHVDNPNAPTLDLNFGTPKLVFQIFDGTWTDNNRYNQRYSKQIKQITDRNSKVVEMHLFLNESDMYNFTFGAPIFIIDSYYICDKILNFTPGKEQSCLVRLIKLIDAPDFVPTTIKNLGRGINEVNDNHNGGVSIGSGNINDGAILIGDNNIAGASQEIYPNIFI